MSNIIKIWKICLFFEYKKEKLINSLDIFLKNNKKAKILDCACGTGFVILDLVKRGYKITFSDGSREMLDHLQRKAKASDLNVDTYLINWSDLKNKFQGQYDIVMCRGCSLPYAGSWDDQQTNNLKIIKDSLRNFYACLKPGGFLYVDTITKKSANTKATEFYKRSKQIGKHRVALYERIKTDKIKKIREWTPVVKVNEEIIKTKRYSYYLTPQKLYFLLLEIGFVEVREVKIPGEHYTVFIAHRPKF